MKPPTMEEIKLRAIEEALQRNNNSKLKAAKELGIARSMVYRYLGKKRKP
jgi:transcriptional regulator with PAS, ATPase and Fis domain